MSLNRLGRLLCGGLVAAAISSCATDSAGSPGASLHPQRVFVLVRLDTAAMPTWSPDTTAYHGIRTVAWGSLTIDTTNLRFHTSTFGWAYGEYTGVMDPTTWGAVITEFADSGTARISGDTVALGTITMPDGQRLVATGLKRGDTLVFRAGARRWVYRDLGVESLRGSNVPLFTGRWARWELEWNGAVWAPAVKGLMFVAASDREAVAYVTPPYPFRGRLPDVTPSGWQNGAAASRPITVGGESLDFYTACAGDALMGGGGDGHEYYELNRNSGKPSCIHDVKPDGTTNGLPSNHWTIEYMSAFGQSNQPTCVRFEFNGQFTEVHTTVSQGHWTASASFSGSFSTTTAYPWNVTDCATRKRGHSGSTSTNPLVSHNVSVDFGNWP